MLTRVLRPTSGLLMRTMPSLPGPSRWYASEQPTRPGADLPGVITEQHLEDKLRSALSPTLLRVQDTSGGCGTFFDIDIEAEAFDGLSKIKQHRLVQDTLREEVKDMHGLSLRTAPVKAS